MVGINRFEGKDKRRVRIKNHIAKDLKQGNKYYQRIVPDKKRIESSDGNFYLQDQYLDD